MELLEKANCTYYDGHYQEALKLYQAYLQDNKNEDELLIEVFNNMATCLQGLKRIQEALDYYQKSYYLAIKFYNQNHELAIQALEHIAGCYHELNQNHLAIKYYLNAYHLRQNQNPADYNMIVDLNRIALCFEKINDLDQAISYHQQCYQLASNLFGNNEPILLHCLNNILNVLIINQQLDQVNYYQHIMNEISENIFKGHDVAFYYQRYLSWFYE